jgi:hypothetical protein
MKEVDIILKSGSIGGASLAIYGYCNTRTTRKIRKILNDNNISEEIFIKTDSKRNIITKKCPSCGNEFKTRADKKEKTCCSIACANSYKPKRIKNPYLVRKKSDIKTVRKQIIKKIDRKCQLCDSDYIGSKKSKFCSAICRNQHQSETMKMNIKNGICKGWQTRNIESYPEKFFKTVLTNNNIDFILNHPVSKKLLGAYSDAYYFIDFYIIKGGKNIDLEIDGKQHKYKDRKDSDDERDILLKNNGYLVHRIEWNEINSNAGKIRMEEKINNFLTFYNKL